VLIEDLLFLEVAIVNHDWLTNGVGTGSGLAHTNTHTYRCCF